MTLHVSQGVCISIKLNPELNPIVGRICLYTYSRAYVSYRRAYVSIKLNPELNTIVGRIERIAGRICDVTLYRETKP